jgi:raffinose/stachyose/melibiose transport system substrate-binding protein
VYYNTKIFSDLGLTPPKTWDELLRVAQTIKDANLIPIANGIYEKTDPQRIGDYYFLSLAPTYIGGAEGRKKFEEGKLCFNDPSVVEVFQAIQDLAPYMPEDLDTLSYTESIQRFYDGRAAMYFSGSFDIDKFEKSAKEDWTVFPIPAPAGYKPYITFHIDTAIGLNKHSPHQKEAIIFLKWLTQRRFGELVGEYLPGFYPLNKELQGDIRIIKNEKAKVFLDFNNNPLAGVDVRWDLPVANVPDGRTLMQQGVFGVIKNVLTPQQAADILQNGLAQWYVPAQKCKPVLTPTPTATPLPTATITPIPAVEFGLTPSPIP